MPYVDISIERCTLIGVNCIDGEDKNAINREWNKRFSQYKAFLIEASEHDSVESIVKGICEIITQRGIASVAGNTCILAIFMDLTGAPKPDLLDALSKIAPKLHVLLQCNVAAVLQFGFAGLVGLDDSAPIRANIQTVVTRNEDTLTRTQLILVSKPALAALSFSVWLPAIVLLDFLRRQEDPAGTLPATNDGKTNNDVGFLSYNEYNERIYNDLKEEAKRLQDSAGNGNKDNFRSDVSRLVTEIADEIDRAYPVDGLFQPLHPDITVPQNKVRKAEKGRYSPYNIAARQTEEAVEKTAKAITKAVQTRFNLSDEAADQKLREAIEASGLGLMAAKDRAYMTGTAITSANPAPERPMSLLLTNYSPDHTPVIDQYLKKVKNYAIYEGRESLYAALRAAYERIDADCFELRIKENDDKLRQVNAKLQGLLSADSFYSNADSGMLPMTGTFSADGLSQAVSRSYFLLRGEERQKYLTENGYSFSTKYFVNEKTGNIQELDDAPMKVVRLTLLDCTPQNLKTLIKE